MKPTARPSIRPSAVTISARTAGAGRRPSPRPPASHHRARRTRAVAGPARSRAAPPGRERCPGRPASEEAEQPLGHRDRLRLIRDRNVHDAVARLVSQSGRRRPGSTFPSPPPSIYRQPAHAQRRALRRDDQVRAARDHGVAGEAAPGRWQFAAHAPTAAPRARTPACREPRPPDSRCRRGARRRPRRRTPGAASARSARTGAGPSCGDPGRPACRPGPCSRTRAPRTGSPSTRAVPPINPSAGVRAIRSSRSRRTLCGDREPPVLDEAAWVDQVLDVLASRTPAGGVPPLDGLRPSLVARQPLARAARTGRPAVVPRPSNAGAWPPRPNGAGISPAAGAPRRTGMPRTLPSSLARARSASSTASDIGPSSSSGRWRFCRESRSTWHMAPRPTLR